MRSIGQLDNQESATRFGDYLYLQGIENEIEDDGGTFSIWVLDDTQLAQASAALTRFRAAPDAAEFAVSSTAAQRRKEEAHAESRSRAMVMDAERMSYERRNANHNWLPLTLIVISGVVALYSEFGKDDRISGPLFISDYRGPLVPVEVAAGQVWRLVTPIFIHLSLLHLIFNMMWLYDLGKFVQERFSAVYLAVFIVISAVLSNLVQYWWHGPAFGGMSGVNYALFGFLWIRGKCDVRAQWQLNPSTVQMMLVWFFLCFTPLLGPVANGAHIGGLVAGAAWGWLSSGRLSFSR